MESNPVKVDELERIRREKMKKLLRKQMSRELRVEASDNDFGGKVIEQSKRVPVVVDFWAPWCAPCLILGPTLEKLVKEYGGRFILAKVNVDEARGLAQKYGIMSIPNVKMFRDGSIVDGFIGSLPEPSVRQWLDKNLQE